MDLIVGLNLCWCVLITQTSLDRYLIGRQMEGENTEYGMQYFPGVEFAMQNDPAADQNQGAEGYSQFQQVKILTVAICVYAWVCILLSLDDP